MDRAVAAPGTRVVAGLPSSPGGQATLRKSQGGLGPFPKGELRHTGNAQVLGTRTHWGGVRWEGPKASSQAAPGGEGPGPQAESGQAPQVLTAASGPVRPGPPWGLGVPLGTPGPQRSLQPGQQEDLVRKLSIPV